MKSWQQTLIGVFVGLILSATILLVAMPPRGAPVELLPAPSPAPISIYVSGAVQKPGVYALPPGSRVEAAIQAAGGSLAGANQEALNLAARLKDGEKVHVPVAGEVVQLPRPVTGSSGDSDPEEAVPITPLNLNTATLEELQTLPGIGETRAKEIIAYRESHGGFKTIEEIQDVPGIGPVLFERMKEALIIE